jgi:hypothetical protein
MPQETPAECAEKDGCRPAGRCFEQEADRVADRVTGAVDAPLKPQTVTG